MRVQKENIKEQLEEFIYDKIPSEFLELENQILALTSNRFDLAFKLMFLNAIRRGEEDVFSVQAYKEHIRALTLGSFKEFGAEDVKNSIEAYKNVFKELYKDIATNGFDANKSIIPLSINGSIINGAHRSSISIFLNKEAEVVKTNLPAHTYNYRYFLDRKVDQQIVDAAAVTFIENSNNTYVAFIWPRAGRYDTKLDDLIPNIVYSKEIELNANGAHNLLSQIYYGEEWLGTKENNFKGVKNKQVECFKTYSPFRVVAFQADSLSEVISIKENIRDVFSVGKHSIHITDDQTESIRVARTIFNDNGIHFLNYSKPNKFMDTFIKINEFKKFLRNNEINSDDVILDSSIVLSVYGLREAADIDYLSCSEKQVKSLDNGIESHDSELVYYKKKKVDLVYNPLSYFYFEDIKFISFESLYLMKKIRSEIKDINDCKIMEGLIENNQFKKRIHTIKQVILYKKITVISAILKFLIKIKLYNKVRTIYRFFKVKN